MDLERDDRGIHWSEAAISQGMQKLPANYQKLERGKEELPYRFQR